MTAAVKLQPEPPPLTDDGGGGLRVTGTRVSLDSILGAYNRRETPEGIAEDYPAVSLAQVYAVIAFYLRHREEVDGYLRRREAEAQELRRQIEARPGNQPTHAQLLARWEEKFGAPFPSRRDGAGA
jgi:uncharacterized protein (DUF433 family)